MKCLMCKQSEPVAGTTSVTFMRGDLNLVITEIPALVCPTCGEAYTAEAVSRHLLEAAREAELAGVGLEKMKYQDRK